MKTFVTADCHLNHLRILQYCPHRWLGNDGWGTPTWDDVAEMNRKIVSNWNSMISHDDEVYIIGDVAMGQIEKAPQWIRQLNGKKYLIKGNHDKSIHKLIINNLGEYDDLFSWIKDTHTMTYKMENGEKRMVVMSHFPYASWDCMSGEVDKTSVHLHGHLHSSPEKKHISDGAIMDVGLDGNCLMPYLLEDAIKQTLKHASKHPGKGRHSNL